MAGGRIPVEQWCIIVQKLRAEETRKDLLREGILDRTLKPGHVDEFVLFPIIREVKNAKRATFEAQKGPEILPRHEMIGGIAIMQDSDINGAEQLLHARRSLHTVLFPESAVEGEYRTRRFTVLAGKPTTKTRYIEYGHRFDIDLGVAYFSARLANERHRIRGIMREGEVVLDMFAGVGPFAITLADKASAVFASDINPQAVRLMIFNTRLNRCQNIVPMLMDSMHLSSICSGRFHRIVMNLPLASEEFLHAAIHLCRDGGSIHFYALQSKEGQFLPLLQSLTGGVVQERCVRSYSPAQHHAVYDIEVKKR
jgi:tRNA (guanine37-N1)-methyltransferase